MSRTTGMVTPSIDHGWPAAARASIEVASRKVPVPTVIEERGLLVHELNVWLHEQLMAQNAATVAEVSELVVDYNAVLTGRSRKEARLLAQRGWQALGDDRA